VTHRPSAGPPHLGLRQQAEATIRRFNEVSDTHASTPWHESIQDYRARGGRPTDHPSSDVLTEIACRMRWIAPERELTIAEVQLATASATGTDRRVESQARWTIELLTDRELADWFVEGLPDDVVRLEEARALDAWDKQLRPWAAEVVLLREGFKCDITGRNDRFVALRLTPREAPDADDLLLEVGAVIGLCERGMTDLEAALDHVETSAT
jgi:hypothetical protein